MLRSVGVGVAIGVGPRRYRVRIGRSWIRSGSWCRAWTGRRGRRAGTTVHIVSIAILNDAVTLAKIETTTRHVY